MLMYYHEFPTHVITQVITELIDFNENVSVNAVCTGDFFPIREDEGNKHTDIHTYTQLSLNFITSVPHLSIA